MQFVIDATALLSVFIARGSTPNLIFIDGVEWLSPDKLKKEFVEHIDEIMPRSSLDKSDIIELIDLVLKEIKLVGPDKFKQKLKEAESIISDPDDTEYIALSLSRNKIPVWSNDPHFKEQTVIPVFKTGELVKYLKSLGLY